MSEINIERTTRATKKDYNDLVVLLLQLSSRAQFSMEEFEHIVEDNNVHLFVARSEQGIVGTGMLVETPIFVERRGRIEDVVVDEAHRNKGIGTTLMEYLILAARGKGLQSVEFSSRPEKEAANTLYKKLGFEQKDTNVYRLEL